MSESRIAIAREIEPLLESLLEAVRPVEECWQPSDLLPSPGSDTWHDEVEALRAEAAGLTDAMLVVLVGNIVTEEGLPSYLAALNRFGGTTDRTGVDSHAWARWARMWTAEEKRHGDVTRTYLYLTGRVDLRAVEVTVQHFLRNGFDTRADGDPYAGLVYASFQEHATKRAWSQLGQLSGSVGTSMLHRICGQIAADEARHERIYADLLREIVVRDPEGGLDALHQTLGRGIVMPARTMTDGADRRLFDHFADVGQGIGVYTLGDYADNLTQLLETVGVPALRGLKGSAAQAQDALLELPARIREAAQQRSGTRRPRPFRWIHERTA